jgi:hypothetical protein
MIERKKDAARIEAHLDSLRQESWIGPSRQRWPKYIFFFAELQNAIRILRSGKLVCRSEADMAVDTGSKEVLDHTNPRFKDAVRLYFRPRTPTQHQVEGFRDADRLGSLGRHMPVPVFFLFDAKDVLTRKTTRFSDGNLSSASSVVSDDADFFEAIPFRKVYHDSSLYGLSELEKRNIIFHKCAEAIVPKELELDSLRSVWCRSEAEYQTLRYSLPSQILRKYGEKLRGRQSSLYFSKWSFVESATLEQSKIILRFNASTQTPGPFAAFLDVENQTTGKRYKWEKNLFHAKEPLTVNIPQIKRACAYRVRFSLDSVTAFAGEFRPKPETAPF